VHIDNQIPVFVGHVLEADISKNTGIVEEDIDTAEGYDGSLDDLITTGDTVIVCYGLTASGLDFVDDNIGSLGLLAYA
jgi:hypothetical protein